MAFNRRNSTQVEGGYSVVVYQDGDQVVAEDHSGHIIREGSLGEDDAAVIQAAIDYLSSGGKVLILDGTYMIGSTIQPRSNVWVFGVGKSTILKRISSAELTNHRMFYAPVSDNLEYFRLSDMMIDANEDLSDYDEGSVCIYIYGDHLYADNLYIVNSVKTLDFKSGSDFSLSNISIETIHGVYADGIDFSDCVGGNIANCYVKSYDDCIVLNGCSFVNINNVICNSSGGLNPAIKLRGNRSNIDLHHININNLTINDRNWGFYFWVSNEVCEIYNINIQNVVANDISDKFIFFRNDLASTDPNLIHDITFSNIRCEDSKYGIYIGNKTATDLVFTDVVIDDTDVYSVYIGSGKNICFSDCIFSNVTGDYYGIYLDGNTAGEGGIDHIVFDNVVSKNHGKDGLYSVEVDGDVRILNSEFSHNGRDGIRIGANHVVRNCYIHDNTEYGILYNDSLADGSVIDHCRFEDNTSGHIYPSSGIVITKNNYGLSPYDWGNRASAPTPFGEGDSYYDTTTHKRYVYDGTSWQALW